MECWEASSDGNFLIDCSNSSAASPMSSARERARSDSVRGHSSKLLSCAHPRGHCFLLLRLSEQYIISQVNDNNSLYA